MVALLPLTAIDCPLPTISHHQLPARRATDRWLASTLGMGTHRVYVIREGPGMAKKLYPCRVWVLEQGNFLSHGAGPRVAEPNGSSPVVENPRGSNIGKTRIREQTHVRMCCTIPSAWPQKTRLSGWGSPLICKQLVVQQPFRMGNYRH
jgi:hypothetical protein